MIFGYVGGIFITYISVRKRIFKSQLKVVRALGVIAGVLSFLPALFLATAIGGNLGGGYGSLVSNYLGLGDIGVPFGLALGVFLMLFLLVSSSVIVGIWIGGLVHTLNSKECKE